MSYIVGITGGSASGKSTFTDVLAEKLGGMNVRVFHMDDYFKPYGELPRSVSPISGKVYADYNHPDSFYIERLREDVASAEEDIVIVEGLLVLWDPVIQEMSDLKIFVDCPADERIVRRIRRNMMWGLSFDEIAEVYLDLVRFRHAEFVEPSKIYADLTVNGSQDFTFSAEAVVRQIQHSADI